MDLAVDQRAVRTRDRFRIGRAASDALKRLSGSAAAVLILLLAGWSFVLGLSFAYQKLYPPVAERWGDAYHPGSGGWALYVALGVFVLLARTLTAIGCARAMLCGVRGPVAQLADASLWTATSAHRITPAYLLLVSPQLALLWSPISATNITSSWPLLGAALLGALVVFLAVGPVMGVFAAERLAPLRSIVRAAALVNRHRWSYVAIWLVFMPALVVVVGVLLAAARALPHAMASLASSYAPSALSQLALGVEAAVAAAAYAELVRLKDRSRSIADVFD